ncbi:MAG: lmo0937 family membrane protein [Gemmatimonadaceae bacterium]
MFLMIGVVLLVAWLLGFLVFKKVVGGLIHILLIIAVILIALHFLGSGGMHMS